MTSLSFKFSKTAEKKVLVDSRLRDASTKDNDEEKDYVKDVADNKVVGTLKLKNPNEPLVIPMIVKNNWRNRTSKSDSNKASENKAEVSENTAAACSEEEALLAEAAREILAETARQQQEWEARTEESGGRRVEEIPAVIANSLAGELEGDIVDVSQRAEASTMDDYENVPIEQYGMAMLRGMGFKEGEGIGGFKKAVVPIFDPLSRPKGLGLGATRPNNTQAVLKEGEEKLVLRRGAHVMMQGGKYRGQYGEVEALDEENGRLFVKLGVSKEVTSVSENVVKLVTKQEFKDKGKVLNLEKYEREKEKDRIKREDEEKYRDEIKKKKKKKYSRRSRSKSVEHKNVKTIYVSDSSDGSPEPKKRKKQKWVVPQLRVRCIDSKKRGGKYFNVKMEVVDVVTSDSCDCRTEEGKLVEDVRPDKLETLIPKREGGLVMVVRGERRGELGRLIARDVSRYLATVQLVQSEDVLKLDYDSVCEYLGSVPDED